MVASKKIRMGVHGMCPFFGPKCACFEQLPYPFQSLQTLTITVKFRFTKTHLVLGQLIITESLLCSWRKKTLTFSLLQPA